VSLPSDDLTDAEQASYIVQVYLVRILLCLIPVAAGVLIYYRGVSSLAMLAVAAIIVALARPARV